MKENMMLLAIFCFSFISAQSLDQKKQIDISAVVFKAKLFTISQHEKDSKEVLIRFIDSLPYKTYASNEFIFIKIQGKRYCVENGNFVTFTWCDCEFYVCYSVKKEVYYFLGGFKTDNINEFAEEYSSSLFRANSKYKIEDHTLNYFIEQLNLGKLKRARKSFNSCTETFNN